MENQQAKIGLIGLAVMGQNFVLNFANKGIPIAVFNRTTSKMEKFVAENSNKPIIGARTMEEYVKSIERPRKIILLVQAGVAVENMIDNVLPYLDKDDIIIDGGNSYFKDTLKRYTTLQKQGIKFIGMGISGGEKGALEGPSLMPGGDRDVYDLLHPLLSKVAAQSPAPCVDYMGNTGAGHFVKMVHNGIEYADMQLIAEVYAIAKWAYGYNNDELLELFHYFNTTDLQSYLIEITSKILEVRDENSQDLLVDKILDRAKGKGTGTWTIRESAVLGTPVPAISAALDSRYISSSNNLRKCFSTLFSTAPPHSSLPKEESKKLLEGALLVGKILSYAQGFSMLDTADKEYNFGFHVSSVAKIWRNGCIIRSTMLDEMSRALEDEQLVSLVGDTYFTSKIETYLPSLRKVISIALESEIPVPALGTSLWYLDGLKSPRLPANLIQAQRDFFGAHTYERIDKDGDFHTQWEN